MTLDVTNFDRLMLDGDGSGQTQLQTKDGVVKFHNRPTTDAYVLEVKSEPTSVSGTFFGMENTVDHKPSTATSALAARAVGGICRLKSTYTMTGGSLIGSYGQVLNDGTINGAAALVIGHYALIEDGGVFTAVNHIAASWLDSHLTKTVTAGRTSMQYITNNGTTVFDNVFYIYVSNKFTNFFTIEGDTGGMVAAKVDADIAYGHYRKVAVNVGGEAGWLLVGFDS